MPGVWKIQRTDGAQCSVGDFMSAFIWEWTPSTSHMYSHSADALKYTSVIIEPMHYLNGYVLWIPHPLCVEFEISVVSMGRRDCRPHFARLHELKLINLSSISYNQRPFIPLFMVFDKTQQGLLNETTKSIVLYYLICFHSVRF